VFSILKAEVLANIDSVLSTLAAVLVRVVVVAAAIRDGEL
jgi:hypothetical protein